MNSCITCKRWINFQVIIYLSLFFFHRSNWLSFVDMNPFNLICWVLPSDWCSFFAVFLSWVTGTSINIITNPIMQDVPYRKNGANKPRLSCMEWNVFVIKNQAALETTLASVCAFVRLCEGRISDAISHVRDPAPTKELSRVLNTIWCILKSTIYF